MGARAQQGTALEEATVRYWLASQASLNGYIPGFNVLKAFAQMESEDLAKLRTAASSSLAATKLRATMRLAAELGKEINCPYPPGR